MSSVHAVITAAGSSSRMDGIDKLTIPVGGTPLLIRTLQPFLEYQSIGEIVITVNPERVGEFTQLLQDHISDKTSRLHVTAGGAHRQQSILLGLRLLGQLVNPSLNEPIMIHDGARPFVTAELFRSLLERLEQYDGVIPALPVRDTVKRVRDSDVLGTEDRETLRLVQTPQVFRLNTITELHEKAREENFLGTDDASLLEKYGRRVGWVEGPLYNLKITLPEDVRMLTHLFDQAQTEASP